MTGALQTQGAFGENLEDAPTRTAVLRWVPGAGSSKGREEGRHWGP